MRGTAVAFGVVAGAAVGLLASTVAHGEPEPPPTERYEYAVRCVFKGQETGIVANYKLRCTELGTEITICPSLGFEVCQLGVVNEMGQKGWRLMAKGSEGLGPSASLTFEREVEVAAPEQAP